MYTEIRQTNSLYHLTSSRSTAVSVAKIFVHHLSGLNTTSSIVLSINLSICPILEQIRPVRSTKAVFRGCYTSWFLSSLRTISKPITCRNLRHMISLSAVVNKNKTATMYEVRSWCKKIDYNKHQHRCLFAHAVFMLVYLGEICGIVS